MFLCSREGRPSKMTSGGGKLWEKSSPNRLEVAFRSPTHILPVQCLKRCRFLNRNKWHGSMPGACDLQPTTGFSPVHSEYMVLLRPNSILRHLRTSQRESAGPPMASHCARLLVYEFTCLACSARVACTRAGPDSGTTVCTEHVMDPSVMPPAAFGRVPPSAG